MPSKREPPFLRASTKKATGNARKGLIYEEKLQETLLERFGDLYVPSPWFHYKELGKERTRWCQPDGLLFIPMQSRIIIVEAKLKHTSDAWWQLKQLYLPIIASLFPPDAWTYGLVEVVKWFDPDTPFPEKVKMCSDILSVDQGEFGVHIWMPR